MIEEAAEKHDLPLGFEGEVFSPNYAIYIKAKINIGEAKIASLGQSGLSKVEGNMELNIFAHIGQEELVAIEANSISNDFIKGTNFNFVNGFGILLSPSVLSPISDGVRTSCLIKIPFYAFMQ